jgi:uncharacterized coiled-coil DUF342 family protein
MGIEKPQLSQEEFNNFISRYISNLKSERDNLRKEIRELQQEIDECKKNC